MTRAEVEVLLSNQAKARARGPTVVAGEGLLFGPVPRTPTLAERTALIEEEFIKPALERVLQLTLVKPDALPPAVELVLPLPPSWNRAFRVAAQPTKRRHTKGPFKGERVWVAHVYKSAEAEAYAATVGAHVRRYLEEPFARDVMLRVSGEMVMARAGCDLDDRFKVLLDSLQGHVFIDDNQVAAFGDFPRRVDSTNPHVRIVFQPIPVDRYGKALE